MLKKFEIYLFIISLLFGISLFLTSCNTKEETRIRIRTKDNSEEALFLKEEVRNEVLILLSKTNNQSIDFLIEYLKINLNKKFNNINVEYTNDTYPAKSLNGKFLPSGTYPTILIKIEKGLGSNWWSVFNR